MMKISPSQRTAPMLRELRCGLRQTSARKRGLLSIMAGSGAKQRITMHEIQSVPITPENFASFGQVRCHAFGAMSL